MKPSDHPQFFQFPAPEGRSRESTIVLDGEGRFFHEGERVEHPKLEAAMHKWISVHPDDGRMILTNGYDWTYFTVVATPYFVRALVLEESTVILRLSDDTDEPWVPTLARVAENGALVTRVKPTATGGPFDATFTRHAQASLMPLLEEHEGQLWARLGNLRVLMPSG